MKDSKVPVELNIKFKTSFYSTGNKKTDANIIKQIKSSLRDVFRDNSYLGFQEMQGGCLEDSCTEECRYTIVN